MSELAVGDAIFRIRKERNLSLDDLAQVTGVHRNTLYRIEAGGGTTLTVLSRIAQGLQIDTWRLMRYADHLSPKNVTDVVNS